MGRADSNELGRLEAYRNYLRLLAELQLPADLKAKLDRSDIVQETLLKAHTARSDYQGTTDGEFVAWLRSILSRQLADAVRRYGTGKRDVGLEQSLDKSVEDSAARLENMLPATGRGPCDETMHQEDLLKLSAALGQLPEDQRSALEMKHLQGLSVAEISQLLNRSRTAVGGLLRRGMKRLREHIEAPR